jgi:hypothetical protein
MNRILLLIVNYRELKSMRVRFRSLTKKFKITPKQVIEYLEGYMTYFGDVQLDKVREYPPNFPENTYERTYALYRAWKKEMPKATTQLQLYIYVDGTQLRNEYENVAGIDYSDIVQGQGQWDYHAGHGWLNAYNYLNSSRIRLEYKQGLSAALKTALERS